MGPREGSGEPGCASGAIICAVEGDRVCCGAPAAWEPPTTSDNERSVESGWVARREAAHSSYRPVLGVSGTCFALSVKNIKPKRATVWINTVRYFATH